MLLSRFLWSLLLAMPDIVTELGKLINAQQNYVHQIMDEMSRSEGRHYDMLEQHLERQVEIKEQLIDSLKHIIGGP